MNPPARPSIEKRTTYQPRSAQEHFIVPLIRDAVTAAIVDEAARLKSRPNGTSPRVLDLGCGGQPFRQSLESTGFDYHSLDAVQNSQNTVEFIAPLDAPIQGNLLRLPLFDLLLCTEVLEHVADWPAAFTNIARLLAPGGRVVITCPQVYQLHEEPYDFWRPTIHALHAFADRAALTVIRLDKLGDGWDVLGTILANISAKPARNTPPSRLNTWWTRRTLKGLSRRLVAGSIQRHAIARGPLYLANLAILEKP